MYYIWLISGIAIIGGLLNAYGKRKGFYFYIVADIAWIIFCYFEKLWGQIPMWIVFTSICIVGLYQWKKKRMGE